MKCQICDNFFIKETSFINLFEFRDICQKCELLFNVEPKYEVIPIDNGLIYYYYLYEDVSVNQKQRRYLKRYFKKLFMIPEIKKASFVFIIDDNVFESLKKERFMFNGYPKIIFMSLFRYDFVEMMNF